MITCNGRNLNAPLTGVQRYTVEILSRIPEARVVKPGKRLSGMLGHGWEQFVLPFHVGKRLLWSPANTGPLTVHRQVVTVHDLATIECPEGFSRRYCAYYAWLLPKLLPRVRAIITVSEFTRQRLIENFHIPPERVYTVPNGIDHNCFYLRAKEEILGLRSRVNLPARYILSLGTLSARKNMVRLIEAWRIAQKNISEDIELIIAGGVGEKHIFNGTALTSLPPRTRLIGRVADGDLPILFNGASLFAFPSLYEGFGLPPLEAMACGTPCLVSNTTSLPEVTGNAAGYVDPMNIEYIASGIIEMLNNPDLLARYSALGLEHVKKFQWDTTAKATHSILLTHQ